MIAVLLVTMLAFDDHGYGPVDPVPLPDISVTRQDGAVVRLRDLTAGKRTAVQFIFTNCPTACPLLGSLFSKVLKTMEPGPSELLSISVDPERDTPGRLAEWLGQFGGGGVSRWVAVRPGPAALAELRRVFGQKEGPPTGHALQVFYVDAESRYVARTTDLPRAAGIIGALAGRFEMAGKNAALASEAVPSPPSAATGEAIYQRAQGVVARVNGETVMAGAARCANCHGDHGEGRREGALAASPLHRSALGESHSRRGGPPSRYSRETFCHSLRRGIDPAGVVLDAAMPRYDLSDQACGSLWDFVIGR